MCVFFFFNQKTAYEMRISDWSSDVCSSDLHVSADGAFADDATAHAPSAGDRIGPDGWLCFNRRSGQISHRPHRIGSNGIAGLYPERLIQQIGQAFPPSGQADAFDIGRASCRERVCQYVLISVDAVLLKKQTEYIVAQYHPTSTLY